MAVELPDRPGDVFRLTVKKAGVEASPEYTSALEKAATPGGHTFLDYLSAAEAVYRDARKRSGTTRKPVLPPGKGLDPAVRETIEDELPTIPHGEPIALRWQKLDNELFFDIDREDRTIVLNQHYRAAILGGRRGGLNDAPYSSR